MLVLAHETGFARRVGDEVLSVDRGLVVEHAPPQERFEDPRPRRRRSFPSQVR